MLIILCVSLGPTLI